MAEDLKVGSAYVELVADDSGLAEDVRAKVEAATAGVSAPVHLEINDEGFREKVRAEAEAASAQTKLKLEIDPGHLRAEIEAATAGARAGEEAVKIPLEPDDTGLQEKVSRKTKAVKPEPVKVPVEAETEDFETQFRSAMAEADKAGDDAASSLRQSFSSMESGSRSLRAAMADLEPAAENAGSALADTGNKAGSAGSGASSGGQGFMGLSGMMWTAVAAGSALAPVLAALPALLAGAGSAVGTLGLGFSGVIKTLHDYSAASAGAGQSAAQQAQTAFSNALAIQSAEKAIADAKRQAADAAIQSANAIISADQQVASAEHAAAQAAQALAQAKADAANQIADVNNSAADAANGVTDAQLAAQAAQQNYTAVMANSLAPLLAKQQAAQQLKDAEQAVTDATQRSKEATEAATKANAEGANGLPSVVNAQYSYEQAVQGVANALRNQANVQRSTAEQAQQSIAAVRQAEENLSNTYKQQALAAAAAASAGGGMNAFAADMAKLAPAGRELVNQLISMKSGFHELSVTAQTTMLPGFTQMLRDIAPMLGPFNTAVGQMGTVIGGLARQFGGLFSDPAFRGALITVLQEGTGLVQQLGSGFVQMFSGIVQAAAAAGPIVAGLGQGFHDLMASGIPAFFSGLTVNAGGAGQSISGLLGIVSGLLGPIGTLAGAFSGALGPALVTLAPAVAQIATSLVQGLLPVMGPLSDGLKSVATFIANNTAVLTPLIGIVLGAVAATRAYNTVVGLGKTLMDAYRGAIKLFTAESLIAQTATKAWTILQGAFNLIMDANPIFLVVAAIAGLAAGIVYAWTHFSGFRDFLKELWADIRSIFSVFLTFVEGWWSNLMSGFTAGAAMIGTIWNGIKAGTKAAWDLVKSYVIEPIREAWSVASGILDTMVNTVTGLPGKFVATGAHLWDWLGAGLKWAVNGVIKGINVLIDGINSMTSGASDAWTWAGVPPIPPIDKIQLLAEGGIAVRPGWAVVGDKGPELLNMNAGAAVVPLDDRTRAAALGPDGGRAGNSGGIHVHGDIHVSVSAMYDFTNPNAMSATSRKAAVQIRDALRQVEQAYT